MFALREARPDIPLVVDLDGTLIRSDLLVESGFAYLGADPLRLPRLLQALQQGKASLKNLIARDTEIDPSTLPYDRNVLALIEAAKSEGRAVYVASASPARYVDAICRHLGVFDGWFSTDDATNLAGRAKADRLVAEFGRGGFDYIGDGSVDLPVWTVARRRIAVHPSQRTRRALAALDPEAEVLEAPGGALRAWRKLLRIQQWSKNALVFVAVVTAHHFDALSLLQAACAFLAFSLAASSIYILNDLVDIGADRSHPTKKARPLAAGTVSLFHAIGASALLLVAALAVSLLLPWLFSGILLTYLVLTTAYTFSLKRKMVIDVVTLAALYTIRVLAGAAAISVPVSEWLLGFSILIFTALALIKRYIELAARLDADLPDPKNRNYQKTDLPIVAALAAAASFNAVTLFAIYISSDAVTRLYSHPAALWLICPVLMYWLSRALIMAHRRYIEDDPVAFALRDRNSLLAAVLIGIILVGAI
jgi:4-hydroxybenzoate polyprenyltransferase/phosphoserine phosphatase